LGGVLVMGAIVLFYDITFKSTIGYGLTTRSYGHVTVHRCKFDSGNVDAVLLDANYNGYIVVYDSITLTGVCDIGVRCSAQGSILITTPNITVAGLQVSGGLFVVMYNGALMFNVTPTIGSFVGKRYNIASAGKVIGMSLDQLNGLSGTEAGTRHVNNPMVVAAT